MSLTNIDYMSGVSPYVLPQVEPVPPQTPRGQRSSTAGTPRNNTGRSRGGRRVSLTNCRNCYHNCSLLVDTKSTDAYIFVALTCKYSQFLYLQHYFPEIKEERRTVSRYPPEKVSICRCSFFMFIEALHEIVIIFKSNV